MLWKRYTYPNVPGVIGPDYVKVSMVGLRITEEKHTNSIFHQPEGNIQKNWLEWAFLQAQWVKNLPVMKETQETRVQSLSWEVSPWRRKWHPTPVLLPEKFHGWRKLVDFSPWGCKESDMTEHMHTHTHTHTVDLQYRVSFRSTTQWFNYPAALL